MWCVPRLIVTALMILGIAAVAMAGDVVVDGKVISEGGGFQFPDGSVQTSAALPKWHQVAIVDVNGRGDYTDPLAAMTDLASWCPAPSAAAPCLVKILPGTYAIGAATLTMEPHVEIEGSGRGITVIGSSAGTAVAAADHSALRSLTIIDETSLASVTGIDISNADFRLEDVRVEVRNTDASSSNWGIRATDAMLTADSFEIVSYGGFLAYGIETENACSGVIRHATVTAGSPVSGRAEGIALDGTSAPVVVDCTVSVVIETTDTAHGIGVYGPDARLEGVRVDVVSAHHAEGVGNHGTGTLEMNGGSIWVDANGTGSALGALDGVTIVRNADLYAKSATGWAFGIFAANAAEVVVERATVTAEGGTLGYGLYASLSAVARLTDVIVRVFGGSTYNYGIHSDSSAPFTVDGCSLTASDGASWGVLNSGAGGAGGTIDHSTVTGGTTAIRNDNTSADLFVGDSKLVGGVTSDLTCFGNYDATYTAVTCP